MHEYDPIYVLVIRVSGSSPKLTERGLHIGRDYRVKDLHALFHITYKYVLCLPTLISVVIPCHPAGGPETGVSERNSCTSVIFERTLVSSFCMG